MLYLLDVPAGREDGVHARRIEVQKPAAAAGVQERKVEGTSNCAIHGRQQHCRAKQLGAPLVSGPCMHV